MQKREIDIRSLAKLIVALLLTILVIVFVLANIQDTRVNFLLFSMEGPLALVLFLTFAVGVATGILGSLAATRRRKAADEPAQKTPPREPRTPRPSAGPSPKPRGEQ